MITLEKDTALTRDVLSKLLALRPNYAENELYYRGYQKIKERTMNDSTKPNNKLVNAFAAYIVDVNVGYFMGQPVSFSSKDDTMMEALQEVLDYNDEQDENVQLAKDCSICGKAYELMYMDEDAKIRFNRVHPSNLLLIYDTKITPEPWAAIRIYLASADSQDVRIDVYTVSEITTYKTDAAFSTFTELGTEDNIFEAIPVAEYLNNEEELGDFDRVKSLIDAYDKAESDTANDFEYFTDAYLHLHNMDLTADQVLEFKEKRVIQTEGEAAGIVEWVVKDIQDGATENYKNRLQADIHRFSKTPNLTDEAFAGNLTGVALSYKLLGLEWNASNKERKFKRGLQRRLELIFSMLSVSGKEYDYRDISIEFNRNLPQNEAEIVEEVTKLKGIISDKTLLGRLPFIDDVREEEDRIEDQALNEMTRTNPTGNVDLDQNPDGAVDGQ